MKYFFWIIAGVIVYRLIKSKAGQPPMMTGPKPLQSIFSQPFSSQTNQVTTTITPVFGTILTAGNEPGAKLTN